MEAVGRESRKSLAGSYNGGVQSKSGHFQFLPQAEDNVTTGLHISIVYGLLVSAALIGLFYTVLSLSQKTLERNTVTRTEIYVDPNMTFPTITLCNNCIFNFQGKNESDPLYRLLAKGSDFGYVLPDIDFSDASISSFLERPTTEIFDEYAMDVGLFLAEYDEKSLGEEYFEPLDSFHGRCYQFNGPQHVARHGPWRSTNSGRNSGLRLLVSIRQDHYGLSGDWSAGLRVHISHPKDSPQLQKGGIYVMPGTSTHIAIKPRKISFLPYPYKSFGSEYCVDVEENRESLLKKMVNATFYSHQTCLDQCIAYKASLACGCHNPSLVIPGLPPCTALQYVFGCFEKNCDRISNNASQLCDCPRPCTFTHYDFFMSASSLMSKVSAKYWMKIFNETDSEKIRENYVEIRIHYESPLIRAERHDPEYTLQRFISALGGQMGLCLGASLISLLEVFEVVLQTAAVYFRRLRSLGDIRKSRQ